VAMRMFGRRATDYFRAAGPDDRRYLLYNPIEKMKVTTEGEGVINLLWDVIAAKGFEKDTYFEMAARDIRGLPKLEGTVHVNMALVLKFMANYFFNPGEFAPVPPRRDGGDDPFLFAQGPTSGLGRIQFHDWKPVYDAFASVPNVARFTEQAMALRDLLTTAPPAEEQQKDLGFLLLIGELFTLVVYGQLILEQAQLDGLDPDVVDQAFDVFVRDFSAYAVELHGQASANEAQREWALGAVRAPVSDPDRYGRVWAQVAALSGAYEMRP
jgi:acyl-CoA dehydrogenase